MSGTINRRKSSPKGKRLGKKQHDAGLKRVMGGGGGGRGRNNLKPAK